MKRILLFLTCLLSLGAYGHQPPMMGWSSWNTYRVNISDSLIMRQADAMVANGLKKVGYNYVNIDDGYFGGRDQQTGRLLVHPERFPQGLKPVVEHIHRLGLKAGIYSDAGRNTCGSIYDADTIGIGVGLYTHDQQDCDMFFRELGFDFIKVDYCGGKPHPKGDTLQLDEQTRYTEIAEAIRKTGRKDVRMNACRWDFPGTWVCHVAGSWRHIARHTSEMGFGEGYHPSEPVSLGIRWWWALQRHGYVGGGARHEPRGRSFSLCRVVHDVESATDWLRPDEPKT